MEKKTHSTIFHQFNLFSINKKTIKKLLASQTSQISSFIMHPQQAVVESRTPPSSGQFVLEPGIEHGEEKQIKDCEIKLVLRFLTRAVFCRRSNFQCG